MGIVGEDALEGRLGVVGHDDVEHAAGAGAGRIVASLDQTFAIGIQQ